MFDEFSQRLQWLMDEKKITQADLARLLDIHESRVSEWIKGKIKSPQRRTIQALCDSFSDTVENCTVDWLKHNEGPPPTPLNISDNQVTGGDIVGGNQTKSGGTQLSPIEKSFIELNRVYGSEAHLKKLIAELMENS